MTDETGFHIYVDEITPRQGTDEGRITFRLESEEQDLAIVVPYFDAAGYDDAVKQAAQDLVRIAEALAAGARRLAK